ncbi:hypothetical protein SKAU_G00001790 [Synaphobranchus kaupii]|uniref:Uncharacterized protein n=1 Tax=Synaphobranchus kaupii TaxID=118154 RepID=A0A9Q1G9H4_SYNKA|nr:hypothetical protein SKAU_G00001790 [Synaphobranchus kaupii]
MFQQGYQQAGIHQQPSLEGRHSCPPRLIGVKPSPNSSFHWIVSQRTTAVSIHIGIGLRADKMRHSLPPRPLGVEPSTSSSSGTVSLWHGAATPPLERGLHLTTTPSCTPSSSSSPLSEGSGDLWCFGPYWD